MECTLHANLIIFQFWALRFSGMDDDGYDGLIPSTSK